MFIINFISIFILAKIIKLDKALANQIAAGEVVERPVSVVKELVENSIDAGADSIRVEIRNGGIDEIIVSDNGEGIEKDDLALSIEKYSTSKIKNLEDLYNVMTFGFRGEALSSISSVCKFEIASKHIKANSGYSYRFADGESSMSEIATNTGTKITVSNLFYNTPARLNYLKKARTEISHISTLMNDIALAYPNIGFEFVSEGNTTFKYKKGEDLKTRIYSIYGSDFASNLLQIDFASVGLKVSGYITDPKVSFKNRNRQLILVNHRVIKSPLIYKAIADGYNRFIPHTTFPGYVFNIEVDPTQVDVNVHPRKQEIRFANESNIFRTVYHAVEDKLNGVSLISSNEVTDAILGDDKAIGYQKATAKPMDIPTKSYYTGSGTKFKSYSPYKDTKQNPAQSNISDAINFSKQMLSSETGLEHSNDLHDTPLGKIIGQTFNSYIVVESEDGIKILDQHALAERVIYEKLVSGAYNRAVQGLLIGESLNLTSGELDILENNKEVFSDMGFDFEIMSKGIVMINAIPDFIKKENIKNIFLGILEDIGEQKSLKSNTLDEVRNKIYAYASCRAAIKFGNKLNLFEMNKLLFDASLDYSATCPHGRPVIYEIGLEELKNKYER